MPLQLVLSSGIFIVSVRSAYSVRQSIGQGNWICFSVCWISEMWIFFSWKEWFIVCKKKKDVRKEGVNAEFQMLLPEKVDRYGKCVPSLYFESGLLLRWFCIWQWRNSFHQLDTEIGMAYIGNRLARWIEEILGKFDPFECDIFFWIRFLISFPKSVNVN